MQRMSEDPKTECEQCGGALERLISSTSFQLKGGGWYKDLYSSPKPAASGSSEGSSGGSEGKSESKGESKDSTKGSKKDPKAAASS
jgi:predicted nucleic acid-binding Zn ribbon protein